MEELEIGNLTCIGSDEDKDKPMNVNLFDDIKVDNEIKAVVITSIPSLFFPLSIKVF